MQCYLHLEERRLDLETRNGFHDHNSACDFARDYFSSKFPNYGVKLQTANKSDCNIRIYLSTKSWPSSSGHINIPIGWIFRLECGYFGIAIDQNIHKYVGTSPEVDNAYKDFERTSNMFEKIARDNEEKYYSSLLQHVSKLPGGNEGRNRLELEICRSNSCMRAFHRDCRRGEDPIDV